MMNHIHYTENEYKALKTWYDALGDNDPVDGEKYDRLKMMEALRNFQESVTA